jgi:hypothetical protein
MVEAVADDFEGAREMPRPRLTFACELSSERLGDLFADGSIVAGLRALDSRVALALAAFTPERAGVVRRLNDESVPVVAIPLLSFDEGYYFTADNFLRAADRYEEWKAWTDEQRLVWDGVGLDIEPDVRLFQQIADNPWGVIPMLLPRIFQRDRPRRAAVAYAGLVARIRADGWQVENYQFPPMADERRAGSDLLQRLAGLVEVTTDREVSMLYSSFLRSLGPGMIWSYGPAASAIAVGSTGGAPDIPGHPQVPSLGWDELERDLLLASRFCDDLYIHSLEGCVEHGFFERISSIDWDKQAGPPDTAKTARAIRGLLTAALWTTAHPALTLGGAVLSARVWSRARRR